MIPVEPVEGVADQKRPDLVATVIKDVALPLRVEALSGVCMFEKVGAVEEDRPGGPNVVIVSDRFWREVMGGQPSALGETSFPACPPR